MNYKHLSIVCMVSFLSSCTGFVDTFTAVRNTSLATVQSYANSTQTFYQQNGEAKTLTATQDAIKASLKDPESAKFKDVKIVDYLGGKVICGSVNAKNSYGGYVGFKRFVASPQDYTDIEEDPKYPEINEASNAGLYAACGR